MTATERAKRSDALYYETVSVTRRVLCDMIANREADLEDARAENAKLREQVERLRTQLADVTESVGRVEERCAKTFEVGKRWMAKAARFEAENDKLRELVRHMYTCMEHYESDGSISCDRCPLDNDTGDCDYERRMRELGVDE